MEDCVKIASQQPLTIRSFDWECHTAYVRAAKLEVVKPRNG
jgi:hypothetical protein